MRPFCAVIILTASGSREDRNACRSGTRDRFVIGLRSTELPRPGYCLRRSQSDMGVIGVVAKPTNEASWWRSTCSTDKEDYAKSLLTKFSQEQGNPCRAHQFS